MYKYHAIVVKTHTVCLLQLCATLDPVWSQNNAVYICKRIKVLQKKMKVLRKINVLSVNKNKELQKKMKYCKKKISFANKNKELQNINETEQKQ